MNNLTYLQVGCLSSPVISSGMFGRILIEPSHLTHLYFQQRKVPWDQLRIDRTDRSIQYHMPCLVFLSLAGYYENTDFDISRDGFSDSLILMSSWASNLQTWVIGSLQTNEDLKEYFDFSRDNGSRFSELKTLVLETSRHDGFRRWDQSHIAQSVGDV
jgi:hypothetical protein